FAVEAMLDDQLYRDAQGRFGGQTAVFENDECGLQVVVERDRARSINAEIVGRGLSLEMDENALDDLAVLESMGDLEDRIGDVLVDFAHLAHLDQGFLRYVAGADVPVKRVYECIGFGIVAEESLANRRALRSLGFGARGAGAEQRRQLVPQLVFDGAKTK